MHGFWGFLFEKPNRYMCTQDWMIFPAHSFVKFLVQLLLPEIQHISYHQSDIKEEQGKNRSRAIQKAKEGNN